MGNADVEKLNIADAFEAQLLRLKNAHAQNNEKLMNSLSTQKALQNTALRERLERREKLKQEERLKAASTNLSEDELLQKMKTRHVRLLSRLEAFIEVKKLADVSKLMMDKTCSQREK